MAVAVATTLVTVVFMFCAVTADVFVAVAVTDAVFAAVADNFCFILDYGHGVVVSILTLMQLLSF